jgi:site-specific DNA-adenine methylase
MPRILHWRGSKRHVARVLIKVGLPSFELYVEPFLGSAAMFLALAHANLISSARLACLSQFGGSAAGKSLRISRGV